MRLCWIGGCLPKLIYKPKKAVLYLFGGGYILPPDPGDIVLCGQIADNSDAEVWFPLYPMAPSNNLSETLASTLEVYKEILKRYDAEDVRFFDSIAPVLADEDDAYLLSPLLFDLTGFPEIDIFYGTREVMIAYLNDFKEVCKRYGVKLNVHIGKGMMHCWGAMEFVPEARAVRQEYFKALS